jgi:hypothetical protein
MKTPEKNSALYNPYVSYSFQGFEAVRRGKGGRIFGFWIFPYLLSNKKGRNKSIAVFYLLFLPFLLNRQQKNPKIRNPSRA